MHQAVVVTHRSLHNTAALHRCLAGHRSHVVSGAGLVFRFAIAAVLMTAGVRIGTASLAMLPVGWTLASAAAGIMFSTFMQHANHLRGVCVDCESAS